MNYKKLIKIRMRCLELAAVYSDNTHDNARIGERFFNQVSSGIPYSDSSDTDKWFEHISNLQRAKDEAYQEKLDAERKSKESLRAS